MTDPTGVAMIVKAAEFAASKHRDQRRKSAQAPYINHPLAVARLLSEVGGVEDVPTLVGAILHDTVEDTATTFEEIEAEFGREVARIVAEVTDDKSLPSVTRKHLQIEHASEISEPGRLVKLGDKLHNLRDLLITPPIGWDLARIQGYFCWAHEVVQAAGNVNPGLWAGLEEVFASEFLHEDRSYRAVPVNDAERRAILESYYAGLEASD